MLKITLKYHKVIILLSSEGAFSKNTEYNIQGDQKNVPPLPGRDEKFSRKTEYSIFKHNLFKYYLENFVKTPQN